jgi:hypothetical protein
VRDADEIARRERAWELALGALEYRTGRQASALPAAEFRELLEGEIDLKGFKRRRPRRQRGGDE